MKIHRYTMSKQSGLSPAHAGTLVHYEQTVKTVATTYGYTGTL